MAFRFQPGKNSTNTLDTFSIFCKIWHNLIVNHQHVFSSRILFFDAQLLESFPYALARPFSQLLSFVIPYADSFGLAECCGIWSGQDLERGRSSGHCELRSEREAIHRESKERFVILITFCTIAFDPSICLQCMPACHAASPGKEVKWCEGKTCNIYNLESLLRT